MRDWNLLMHSTTESTYYEQIDSMNNNLPSSTMNYLASTWLLHKEKFVSAWLDGVRHYGHISSSRVEGAHAVLKRWIEVSTGNLLVVHTTIEQACSDQLAAIRQQVAYDRSRADLGYGSVFAPTMGKISVHVLKSAHKEYELSRNETLDVCRGMLTSNFGYPCVHRFQVLAAGNAVLSISDFDSHWWLQQPSRGVVAVSKSPTFSELLCNIQATYNVQHPTGKESCLN